MGDMVKRTEELDPADLAEHPVWEYVSPDDTIVRPVLDIPVESLRSRIVGTRLRLANGQDIWAILSNVHLRSLRKNEHFLAVWVEREGQWCELARYHDADHNRRGPERLADFLGLTVAEVFPLTYDISAVACGLREAVRGVIAAEPKERLTEDELIALALESDGLK